MSRFRLGDLQQSDDDLNGAARLALEGTTSSSSPTHGSGGNGGQQQQQQQQVLGELAACALSNRAIVLMRKDLLPLAILEARKAVDVSAEFHAKHSLQVRITLYHLQLLLLLLLASNSNGNIRFILYSIFNMYVSSSYCI